MQLLASPGGGDVENASRLLRFPSVTNPVDPSPGFARIGAFELKRSDEELCEFVGFIRVSDTAFEPRQQVRLVVAAASVKIGDEDDLEFEALRFVNRHELDAAVTGGCRIRK